MVAPRKVSHWVGTNHFTSWSAAYAYYEGYYHHVPRRTWGGKANRFQVVSEAVSQKIRDQEICIGPPSFTAPDYLSINDEGRYSIITPLTPAVTV